MGSFRVLRDNKEDELGLFLDMKKREIERHHRRLLHNDAEFDSSPGNLPILSMPSATTVRKTGANDFLNFENDKNDYEWLLTPPGTPLFPSLEFESHKHVTNPNGTQKARPSPGALKSRLSSTQPEVNNKNGLASRPQARSPGPSTGPRRPSATGSGSRPSTPNGKPVLGAHARPVSNSATKTNPTSTTTIKPRSSTPTSRRPGLTTTKATPRGPTPPQSPTVPSNVPKTSSSPRPRPWKPQEMPGYTLDTPPNLRTSLTDRPRGQAGAPSSRSSSIEPVVNGRVRRQSCSPSRGRLPNGVTRKSGSSVPVPALNRAYAKANDNVSPGLYGTKMVERVVNMRKLAPPKQDDKHSPHNNLSAKSGFGTSLSKKSLDMAMRHMDIRQTLPGNLRPLMTKIPTSSMYSMRSGPTRGRMINGSNSPVATSSNASFEVIDY
ncbi:uncharacterized protein LOC143616954 [Bidens hawaiensis]|uniref:uncharacterized protein LOC143616954 n=1 Tax=Bidens hawaiensis TaxID=980011 RepID=UPI00404A8BAB